ncbi:MAG: double-strand break repair helicase AddA [Hyphomicrobiaceae bacterium]|nr:double-strand break repair helicase AddA [Hyphomicrobiaceae bacterium]
MTPALRSQRIELEREQTTQRQARAADPAVSVWVSANAGTGKTHVLTNRVLRLLVAGTAPERLLCLTYTKAAAAEMSSRVFQRLANWVTASDAAIEADLSSLLNRPPDAAEASRARDLFTAAIETPGGLKVQTIHAFCERLLQRFPLEAGVPPGFQILDDGMKASLVAMATEAVLRQATQEPATPLGCALAEVVAFAHDESFATVLGQALARRDWIDTARRLKLGETRDLDAAAMLYRRALGVKPADTRAAIEAALASVVPDSVLSRGRDVLRSGLATDLQRAGALDAVLGARAAGARIANLSDFFLTTTGEPRKALLTAKLRAAHPDLDARLVAAQATFAQLIEKRGRVIVADATVALLRLASSVMQNFIDLKASRAALDFDDLIRAAGSLLRLGEDAQWVLYKLDGGLDHILVDEAQDTSLTQWRVVEALAREFFAGAGARETPTGGPRTVFAVGDEKQSIYGFQGAAPKMFADMGRRFEAMAAACELAFARVPLTLSFRTVAPILEAVDRIFADPGRARGLTSSGDVQPHAAHRLGMSGLVEVWDTEKPDATAPAPAWRPLDEIATSSPVTRLAERIAETIGGWLATGEQLVSEGRPVKAGDILVLVRRRRPFADAMVAALKARGIPVAGADRLQLADQLVVKDLLALADFLLLPEDDLALAAVLKSPLLGFDDDDLLALAPGRRGSLWSALLAAARREASPRLVEAAERLKRWRTRADVMPPYELLVELLVHDGMRTRLLARLGPEAADPLDELLTLALGFDDEAPPSLQGFVDWIRTTSREIKRDMEHGRDEVRVMTVHGSKGLEAPVVFLADTCAASSAPRPGGLIAFPDMPRPDEEPEPFLWPVKGTAGVEHVTAARAAVRTREVEESTRLLYVALTRARDRLYVTGFEGTKGRAAGCWYDTIEAGLTGLLTESTDPAGRRIRRWASAQTVEAKPRATETTGIVEAAPLPDWALRPAPLERGVSIPLAPSRLAPLDTDDEGDPLDAPVFRPDAVVDEAPPPASPRALAEEGRFLRGTIIHALLQYLPGLPVGDWEQAATRFVEVRGAGLRAQTRSSIVAETLAVLHDPIFAPVFGPGSRAEVPVVAQIEPPERSGQPLRITGQIDRLVVTDHEILIVDFKTNRPPPLDVTRVAQAYVVQLAAYHLAISHIFKDRPVRAALLWTDGPRLMELPADRLDEAAAALFTRGRANLDA